MTSDKSPSSKPATKPKKSSRRKKLGITLLCLALFYILFGFFAVPPILKAVAQNQVPKHLNASLDLESVSFNPLTLRLQLDNLSLKDPDDNNLITLGHAEFALSPSSIFHFAPVIKEIILDEPALFITRDSNNEINLLKILPEPDETSEPEEDSPAQLPKIRIDRFALSNGSIELKDEALRNPATLSFSPINFDLNDFATFGEGANELKFAATSRSGGSLQGAGSLTTAPLGAKTEIALQNFDLSAFSAYISEFIDIDFQKGNLDLELSASLQLDSEEEMITGNLKSFILSDLTLLLPDATNPFFSLAKFELKNARFSAWDPAVEIESIEISDGNLHARRLRDETIDLLTLIPNDPKTETAPATAPPESSTPFPLSFTVHKIEINRFSFSALDLATADNALLSGQLSRAIFSSITEDFTKPVPFKINGSLLETGSFNFDGQIALDPLSGELDLALSQIPLQNFNPWGAAFTDLSLKSGSADLSGKLTLQPSETGLPLISFSGKTEINQFEATENDSPIAGFDSFAIDGLHLLSEPLTARTSQITLENPHADLVLEEDGNLNILRLLHLTGSNDQSAEITGETTPEQPDTPPDSPLNLEIKSFLLSGGKIDATDKTVSPAYSTSLQNLFTKIENFSLTPENRTAIELSADLPAASRIKIDGLTNAQPETLFADLKIALSGFSLPPVSPYSGQVIGRTISQGRLNFQTTAKIENENLSAQNTLLLKDLHLGERVENSDAPNLPLDLALGLLRDRNGEISFDIPVTGRLDDPQFSIAAIATNAFFTVIRNIASSPFNVLGKLIPGGKSEKDLSEISFAPGSDQLTGENLETLQILANALHQCLTLKIRINASSSPETERPILVENQLRTQLLAHQSETGHQPQNPETNPLEDFDLILSLYETRFGPIQKPETPETETASPSESSETAQPIAETAETAETAQPTPEATPAAEPQQIDDTDSEPAAKKPFIAIKTPQWFKKLRAKSDPETSSEPAALTDTTTAEIEKTPLSEVASAPAPSASETQTETGEEPTPESEPIPLPTLEELKTKLTAEIEIPETKFLELAGRRIEQIKKTLSQTDQLSPDRISTGEATLAPEAKATFELE